MERHLARPTTGGIMGFKLHINSKKNAFQPTSGNNGDPLAIDSSGGQEALLSNHLVPESKIVSLPIESLVAPSKSLRKNIKKQIDRLISPVSEFGQVMPILIDEKRKIVDGLALSEALRKLGATHVNCCVVDHLNEEQLRLLRIALNTIQTKAEWDLDAVSTQLIELDTLGLDLSLSGLEVAELDNLMLLPGSEPDNDIPDTPSDPVAKLGDLWQLGKHRLLCGNALDKFSYETVLDGTKVQIVFTDPPYNLAIKNNVSGLGKVKHDDFMMCIGEMSETEFQDFLASPLAYCNDHSDAGTVFYVCMDWRQIHLLRLAAYQSGLNHINTCVWDKGNGGMGALYRSRHEFVGVFCNTPSPAINNVQLGKFGRNRSNVWQYPGANSPGSSANEALHLHATPKPVELVEDAILDVSQQGAHVLDPFIGSGTTILAAERTKRIAFGIELDPKFVDVAIARWENMTGAKAELIACGINTTAQENDI